MSPPLQRPQKLTNLLIDVFYLYEKPLHRLQVRSWVDAVLDAAPDTRRMSCMPRSNPNPSVVSLGVV